MGRRHNKNFIEAFEDYANDGFVPPEFNTWAAISVVAGALERKVWLPWTTTFAYYPNMYVLFVGLPGTGKSTALNRAVDLLHALSSHGKINFMPSQITEAKFISLVGEKKAFELGSRIMYQSASYYFASEASNSLKEVYGDIIGCMTDFYDCPNFWEKATMKDGKTTLENVCFNLLAGSTFDYLGRLITNDNILGGFASRLTYVVNREEKVRSQKFRYSTNVEANTKKEQERAKLIEDLFRINEMVGPYSADEEFGAAWEIWHREFEERRIAMVSEKMKSLLVRTNTSLFKLAMILSAAESSDRVLRIHHLEGARKLLEETENNLPETFRMSRAAQTDTADGLKSALFQSIGGRGKRSEEKELKQRLMLRGFDSNRVDMTIGGWLRSNTLRSVSADGKTYLELLVNPNEHL